MSDQSEHETHPTVKRMEQVANELFRNADNQEGPQSDIEPEKVNWWERVRRGGVGEEEKGRTITRQTNRVLTIFTFCGKLVYMWMNEARWSILHVLSSQGPLVHGDLLKNMRSAGYPRDNITHADLADLKTNGLITHAIKNAPYRITEEGRKAVEQLSFRLFRVMYSSK